MREALLAKNDHGAAGSTRERVRFLDGLRGWGAVFVLLYHVFSDTLPIDMNNAADLGRLIPFNGPMAVMVFFVVSGFSLSVKYLATGEIRGWIQIASARYPRLVIPIFAICLLFHLAMTAGMIDPAEHRLERFRFYLHFEPTVAHLLSFSLFDVFFRYDASKTYVLPLWTMSTELYGSALVLIAILVLRSMPLRPFLFLVLALLIVALSDSDLTALLALFPMGAAIGDMYLRGWLDGRPIWKGLTLLAVGICVPVAVSSSVFAWGVVGASALTIGSILAAPVRRFLQNPFSTHLGVLSFPLYLVHGPIIFLVGEPLTRAVAQTAAERAAIDIAVVILSFGAAYIFLPVNRIALLTSRAFGRRVANLVLGPQSLSFV